MESLKNSLVQITHDGMGQGDPELGLLLLKNYLTLLAEEKELPQVLAFYNAGVKLICTGSPVLSELNALHERGVRLLACKTCLKHFNLLEQMETGIAGTMMDIIELQKVAVKIVNL